MAKAIINNEVQTVKTIVAEQHGDRVAHANQNLKFGFGNNNQPTGVLAKPGDTVVVYVDAEPGAPLPQLLFSQQEGSFANWGRSVSLQVGKNIITVPEVPQTDKWYRHNVTPGGPVYIVNPYTEEQQGKAPVVRFAEGVELFPMMDKDTDEQEFLTLLKDYKKRVDLDKEPNPDVMDRQMIDVVEVVSNHIVFTGTATGAYEAYINQGFSPMKTVEMYNDHLEFIFNYLGIDGSELIHDAKYIRDNIRLAQPYAAMYAAGNHIGVQNNAMVSLLTSVGTWGIDHEIGHRLDISVRTVSEVTNNMIPQNSAYYYDIPNKRIPFETRVYKNVIATDNNVYVSDDHFEDLAVFWQLEMIYPGYWGKLNRLYRENNVVLDSNNSAADKLNQLAKYSSLALQLDLTEHFERHGFFVSDETKEIVSQYQKPAIKTWYANYDYIEYDGNGFEGETHLVVTRSTNGEHNQLDFNINDQAMDDVLGYEIFKGDQLIGFTSTNSFVDTTTNVGEVVEYTVVPYDKKLNPGQGVSISSLAPTIMTSQETVTVKLNESFNPMQLVKAYTYNNEEITNAVTVDKEIDTTQKGIIPLTFIVENQGITVTKTINVEVVSDYDYLSDKEWTAVETDFGTPRRNTNIKGRVNGEIQTFDKGFGIHANGRITYDLTDLEYDRFEALIGVDMTIAAQNNSSLQAKIIVDGQTLATTPVLKHADNMVLVNVPIKGAKQLVIEINDGRNANTSDHAIIVNPKLITNNAKPELTVTDRSYQLSEVVDLTEGVMAIDAEDGDLTSQVQIISNNYEANKTGRFEVTYQVMDSDGNKVTKTRRIFVYSIETALTDLEWISAVSGWKTVNKDLAVNKTNKIQLKVDGEVQTFDRGIGAATNAEIVYDLNGEYSHFTTYVGTDKNYDDNRGSIIFKIYADGEEVYTSNLIKHDSDAEFVSLNVEGVHELKLVADDSGNGGLGDFASWGNPRLYHTNVKPELMVEEDVTLKLGASLETIIGTYQATDVEDGDLTSQVVVDHSNLNLSKAGTYQITYTVTDSDNNTVSKTRTINLYNKEIALTDLEWISAVSGWKTVNKDLAVNKTNKIQLKVDGEVQTFDRGIGAATNAEIVYQLNGEYSYFTTYVGTDKNYDDNRTSIIFKIYADGKEVYTSNLIKRDSDAEFVSLNVEGVQELKLVADDSGNGGLGDFASWGDPKLYSVNCDRSELDQLFMAIEALNSDDYTEESWNQLMSVVQDVNSQLTEGYTQELINQLIVQLETAINQLVLATDYQSLIELLEVAKAIDGQTYTEESIEVLNQVIHEATEMIAAHNSQQNEVNQMVDRLQEAINQLEMIDFNQVIDFADSTLKSAIIKTLSLDKEEVTLEDLLNLTHLDVSGLYISSLKGLESAKNLEVLDVSYNQLTDFSPLSKLKKLTSLTGGYQFIEGGMLNPQNGIIKLKSSAINRGEEALTPVLSLRNNLTFEEKTLDFSVDEDGYITLDVTTLESGTYSLYISYVDEMDNFMIQTLYMLKK